MTATVEHPTPCLSPPFDLDHRAAWWLLELHDADSR